jgi:nitrite reductase/ring-hydroxylating ferredoxin subunit
MEQRAAHQRKFVVGSPSDVLVGKRKIIDIPRLGEVGIFNIRGEYFAVKNVCPHMGGPMCAGRLTGTTRPVFRPGRRPEPEWIREGEILRCPWHGWEFDIRTGKALFSDRTRIATYDVRVAADDDGAVVDPTPRDAETYPVRVEGERLILEIPDRRGGEVAEAIGARDSDDAG